MVLFDYVWSTATGSSGGLDAFEIPNGAGPTESALFCQTSTLASTQSFGFQTAQASTGPWFTELSTSIGASSLVAAQAALRLTGPYRFMRPFINSASTGTYRFQLIGV